jgi:hypothetical protein
MRRGKATPAPTRVLSAPDLPGEEPRAAETHGSAMSAHDSKMGGPAIAPSMPAAVASTVLCPIPAMRYYFRSREESRLRRMLWRASRSGSVGLILRTGFRPSCRRNTLKPYPPSTLQHFLEKIQLQYLPAAAPQPESTMNDRPPAIKSFTHARNTRVAEECFLLISVDTISRNSVVSGDAR